MERKGLLWAQSMTWYWKACMQSESLDHSLDGGHANLCLLAMSLELALEEVVGVDPSSSTYRRQPIRVFPALTAVSSASVLVGRSVGHPLTIPVVGPTPATRRLLFPVQPTPLLSPPPPCGPTANSVSSAQHSAQRPPSSPQTALQEDHCLARLSCHVCHRGARLDPRWPG